MRHEKGVGDPPHTHWKHNTLSSKHNTHNESTTNLSETQYIYLKHNTQNENTIHLSETQYTVERRLGTSNISAGLKTRRRNTKHMVFLM